MRWHFVILGTIVLAASWLGPLPQLAEQAFFAHMTMHMVVVAVAAPLLTLGLAGSRFDPAERWPRFFQPIPASLVELMVVWAWHAPALHHAARHHLTGLLAEQGTFLLSGLWVWFACLGGTGREMNRIGAGIIGLLLTSMHMTLLGALLALATRPLYTHGTGLFGLSAIEDQHLGGAIMILIGGIAYLAGGLFLTVRFLRHSNKGEKHDPQMV